jgi:hypothetical protein
MLTACAGRAGQPSQATASAPLSDRWTILTTTQEGALPVPVQLALGTMQLDGTENAVTAEQARDLLTLWQGYSSLLAGDSPAQEEFQGLQHQIEETLTVGQLQAIAKSTLTGDDLEASMAGTGETLVPAPAASSRSTTSSGARSGGPEGSFGGPPGGGAEMMLMGGGPPGGIAGDQQGASDTEASTTTTVRADGGIQPQIVQAVIVYLQGRLAGEEPGN